MLRGSVVRNSAVLMYWYKGSDWREREIPIGEHWLATSAHGCR